MKPYTMIAPLRPGRASRCPVQKPGKSEQTVGTPADFIAATEARFGPLTLDLASDKKNSKAPQWITAETDTLSKQVRWAQMIGAGGNGWLNPPFGNIPPFAAKCAIQSRLLGRRQRILLLVPAGVGTNWFAESIWDQALVLLLRSRVKFVGHTQGFPKDLMLCVYGEEPGIELWDWRGIKRGAGAVTP